MSQKISSIKEKIKRLAEEFNLNYDSGLFRVSIISKKDFAKLLYLILCPAKPYSDFGMTIKERESKFEDFLSSEQFYEAMKYPSGTVVGDYIVEQNMKKMKKDKTKKEFNRLIKKINLTKGIPCAVLTEPSNEQESAKVFDIILFHEWIHVLLHSNNIFFQTINLNYWNYDEGLTEYLYLFLSKKTKDFELEIKEKRERIKRELKLEKLDEYIEKVLEKTLFWNNILKSKKTPKERRDSIDQILKKLS